MPPVQGVFPTRMTLTLYKGKQVGAQKGYDLLKKKADALAVRLRALLKEIKETKLAVGKEMNGATFAISEAVWSAGDFKKKVIEAPQRERANVRISIRMENVAGVKLPTFSVVRASSSDAELEMLGLAGGGRQIARAKEKFTQLVAGLVKLGSLQTSFMTLDLAIKLTNRRVNALDNVIIPQMVDTVAYITSELDEMEKEEFFRLKKVLKVKERDRLAALEEEAAAAAASLDDEDSAPVRVTAAPAPAAAAPNPFGAAPAKVLAAAAAPPAAAAANPFGAVPSQAPTPAAAAPSASAFAAPVAAAAPPPPEAVTTAVSTPVRPAQPPVTAAATPAPAPPAAAASTPFDAFDELPASPATVPGSATTAHTAAATAAADPFGFDDTPAPPPSAHAPAPAASLASAFDFDSDIVV